MIFKSCSDNRWYKINPYYERYETTRSLVRRNLFAKGIFYIEREPTAYYLFINGTPIGAWSPGDTDRARLIIRCAFNAYKAFWHYDKHFQGKEQRYGGPLHIL